MNPLEALVELFAPHSCIACAREGSLLCDACRFAELSPLPSRCYRCHKATRQNTTCQSCYRKTGIKHAWVSVEYQSISKKLIHKLKFERAKAVAKVIAMQMSETLPMLPTNIVVSPIPTAHGRIRVRGYDQALLIARELARKRGWRYEVLLVRRSDTRQVGAGRAQRLSQLQNAFVSRHPKMIRGAHILLVDDVLTTGATIEAATVTLKASSAKTVDVAVFAQSSQD